MKTLYLSGNSGRDCSKLPCLPFGRQVARKARPERSEGPAKKEVRRIPRIVLPDIQITKSNTYAVRFSRIIDYFYILIDKKKQILWL